MSVTRFVSTPKPAPVDLPKAGWYADPARRFELRYWAGARWTEHVCRNGVQSVDPQT